MALRFATPADEAYPYQLTIGHLLDTPLRSAADTEIVYRDHVRINYRILRERIGRLASVLASLGANEGTVVGVLDWDSHRYLECYFAIPMMGAVLQTVNVRLPPVQVADTINRAEAEILLVHRDFLPLLDALRPALARLRRVIVLMDGDEGASVLTDAAGEYEALLAAASPDYMFRDFEENAIATLFFTTGTTGRPKAVSFTHRQIVLHALALTGPFGNTRDRGFGIDDVYMPLTPMFHVHAWGMPYVATMLGVKQVYAGRYDPETILRLRAREGVSFSHCVPTILQMILAAADRTGADLSGWLMTIGGSAMSGALCREARRRGMDVVSGYGMSETAPILTLARAPRGVPPSDDSQVAALTVAGIPVPLVSVRIVDEHMHDVPSDGVARGELVVRAPWLTQCYVGDARASDELWRGGWLHTQDVASIDEHGNVHIRDRLKDVIKTGGEWLCSMTIENLIAEVEGVAEIAVVGVAHPQWGERPIGIVSAAPGHTPTLAAVNERLDRAIASGAVSRYSRLDRLEIVDSLPKTSVGKIDKKALRSTYAAMIEAPPTEKAPSP